jgi:hypothetical protein
LFLKERDPSLRESRDALFARRGCKLEVLG